MEKTRFLSNRQLLSLSILRILVGWHLLYEGVTKFLTPGWSAYGYLMSAEGFLSGFFQSMASDATILEIVNLLNKWGLLLIGLGLFIGLLTRLSIYSGALLLLFYYLAHPPFIGIEYGFLTEGNYLLVDKNLIEMAVLLALSFFPTGQYIGLDRIIFKNQVN
ncbi:MAG: DoxX family membrane protein [Bacteroidetes bacterium]|jgi:thiosulfate dehydrogenase [quinone] large subunit|nr:DoxX family membrane protein [Bacteroidota bacterium]